jgi:hypothetical protein
VTGTYVVDRDSGDLVTQLPISKLRCGVRQGTIRPAQGWFLLWADADGVEFGWHFIDFAAHPFTLESVVHILWQWLLECWGETDASSSPDG